MGFLLVGESMSSRRGSESSTKNGLFELALFSSAACERKWSIRQ